jgi:DeoR/GlpR family transcriptional regulator of sugar metabolism
MLAIERQSKIRDFMNEYKHADVTTLSALFSVSEVTIRKDLEKLEQLGIVRRLHGGAVLTESDDSDRFSAEGDPCFIEKQELADLADRLIDPDDIVFLGPGTTCYHIARKLRNGSKRLRIISNSIPIISELYSCPHIDVISTGGQSVQNASYAYLGGNLSTLIFDSILINKAIITVSGISENHGFTVVNPDLQMFYEKLSQKVSELIVAADYSKFDKTSMTPFRKITEIDSVITNENIPVRYKELFFDSGVRLFTTISTVENIGTA